ncbi:hypothetical protein FRC06_003115 [Ceratobasidium sp. 370]|nr:hypothetical protein FRC06_003115 [Ceratobasidium sp. 370]
MRARQLVLIFVPLFNLHAAIASQSVLSAAMTSTSSLTQQVSKLGNGVEVQNTGVPLEGKRKQVVEDVLNWYGLPKAFPVSRTLTYKVISSTGNPNRIVYEQKQEYTIRFINTKKIMESTVVIDLDENDKIVKLEDKWNGQDQPWLRRLNAITLPWLVKVPKPKEE